MQPVSCILKMGDENVPTSSRRLASCRPLQADVLILHVTRTRNARHQCSMRFQRMGSSSHEHHARGDASNQQDPDSARGHALEAHTILLSCILRLGDENVPTSSRRRASCRPLQADVLNFACHRAQKTATLKRRRQRLDRFLDLRRLLDFRNRKPLLDSPRPARAGPRTLLARTRQPVQAAVI